MKVDRLISIIMVLLEQKKISAKSLAEMFEVSLRTIYRDIETINMAGIPIVSIPGVNGGFHILEKYKVDKKVFTASEIVTLLKGLESVSSILSREEISNTLAKVQSLIPAERADEIELKSSQIIIDLQPWKGNPRLQPYLDIIKGALRKQQLLSFQYFDRQGQMSIRTIEPYRLMLKANSWYIQSFCLEKQDFRLFKLTRMANLELLDIAFSPRELPEIISEFTDAMSRRQMTIKIRLHKSIRDKVMDYCGNEKITPDQEDQYIAFLPFIDDEDGYNLLLSFGDKCECLEPPKVRAEMIRRIHKLTKLYEP